MRHYKYNSRVAQQGCKICIQLFRERLSEKAEKCTQQPRKVVWVKINILFISIRNRRCRDLTVKTCVSGQWMKRYSIDLLAATLHMSPKTIFDSALCLNIEEVKRTQKISKDQKIVSLYIRTWNL